MSKFVKVQQGDYKLSVPTGRTITLDVGGIAQGGKVLITNDLEVLGSQTIIDSQTMSVVDNIIKINVGGGDSPALTGIALGLGRTAGIEIDRGALGTAQFVLDDGKTHYNSAGVGNVTGSWSFRNNLNNLMGIETSSISTRGNNLYIDLGDNSSSGYLTVKDVSGYERKVFNYANYDASVGPITVGSDLNAIPNVKGVLDCIQSAFTYQSANNITDYDTSVAVLDLSTTSLPSIINFKVDGNLKAYIDGSGTTIDNIKLFANTIASLNNTSLVLSPVSKTIEASGWMLFDNQLTTPSASASGTYLYANATIGAGQTGLYIVNTTVSDELVSKKRALLFSMIF